MEAKMCSQMEKIIKILKSEAWISKMSLYVLPDGENH